MSNFEILKKEETISHNFFDDLHILAYISSNLLTKNKGNKRLFDEEILTNENGFLNFKKII